MTNSINLHGCTRLDLDPGKGLDGAEGELAGVLAAGFCKAGGEWFAASAGGAGKLLYLLKTFKHKLLSGSSAADD